MTHREMVAAFMQHIGAETFDCETDRSAEIAALRMGLIFEETAETHAALAAGDLVGAADGFADLKYVVIGTAVAYGVGIPDFDPLPIGPPRKPDAADAASLLLAVLPYLKGVVYALAGREDLACALRGLDVAASLEASRLGVPLGGVFAAVHHSNMTKEPGIAIGAAKYAPGGGKGLLYKPPMIATLLEARGWRAS